MATKADVIERFLSTLASDAARRIDFYVGPIHVDFSGFMTVWAAILADLKGSPGIGFEIGNVPAGAEAAYDSDDNVFRVKSVNFGANPLERGVIIHESVHAMRDIWGAWIYKTKVPGVTAATTDEVAAYVAQGIFWLLENTAPPQDSIHQRGYSIAQTIVNRKGAVVSDGDVNGLRSSIAANPVYQRLGITMNSPSKANGL